MTVNKLSQFIEDNSNTLMTVGLISAVILLFGVFYYQRIGFFSEKINFSSEVDIEFTEQNGILHGLYLILKGWFGFLVGCIELVVLKIYSIFEGVHSILDYIVAGILGFITFTLFIMKLSAMGSLIKKFGAFASEKCINSSVKGPLYNYLIYPAGIYFKVFFCLDFDFQKSL